MRFCVEARGFRGNRSFLLPVRSSGDKSVHVRYSVGFWIPGHGFEHETVSFRDLLPCKNNRRREPRSENPRNREVAGRFRLIFEGFRCEAEGFQEESGRGACDEESCPDNPGVCGQIPRVWGQNAYGTYVRVNVY